MKQQIKNGIWILSALLFAITFSACDDLEKFEPLGENSIADATPPSASFTATQGEGPDEEWKSYTFANGSISATSYSWDFGDGNTSTEVDGENTYPGEGMFTVTLTASDDLGVTSVVSETIEIIEPEEPTAILPVIKEPGFEDNSPGSEDCGSGMDGRDCWRISGESVFGITNSPVNTGSQGAKFNANDARVAYQALTVSPNTDYTVTINYTIKTSPVGSEMRLAILGNAISNADEAEAAIIASTTGNNQDSASTYVPLSLTFNTGASDTIAIWVDSNNVAESRIDDVSIVIN